VLSHVGLTLVNFILQRPGFSHHLYLCIPANPSACLLVQDLLPIITAQIVSLKVAEVKKASFQMVKVITFALSSPQMVTKGCETLEMTLRRNALGQLGFHVNFEGVVADVELFGFAWQAGLRPGCRLVEICKVAVGTLTHEQMIDYLRTSTPVTVVVIQPHEDGTPRRYSLSSIWHW